MFVGIYSFDVYSAMQGNSPGAMLGMSHDRNKPVEIALDKLGSEAMPLTPMSASQTDLSITNVNVTAMQFAWIFSYPDYNNLETAELHLPVGSKVKLNLNASDVIHAFWVPQFRLKQDVIPGMSTQLQFTANKIGEYPIVCAELCGAYHGGMRAQLFVDTPEDFQAWVKTTQEELASTPTKRVIAANNLNQPTTAMSDREYLAGRVQSMESVKGVDRTVLRSAHHMHDRAGDRTLSFNAPHS
jgi:cytochrome c oxidase subunit 2